MRICRYGALSTYCSYSTFTQPSLILYSTITLNFHEKSTGRLVRVDTNSVEQLVGDRPGLWYTTRDLLYYLAAYKARWQGCS